MNTAAVAPQLVARHFSRRAGALAVGWRIGLALNPVELLILHVMLSANFAHANLAQCGLLAADDRRRPVSLMAVAQSMGLPHETVRRNTASLEARGFALRADGGWIVPRAVLIEPPGAELVAAAAHDVRHLVDELAGMGLAAAQTVDPARLAALPDDRLARYFIDALVLVCEPLVTTLGDLLNGSIHAAIVIANVEHIAADPGRSRRFARPDSLPPDPDRRPVGIRALARAIDLPYPTVRRRVTQLVERGFAEMRGDGVIVPARVLEGEALARNVLKLVGHLDAMFASLARV